MVSRVTDHAIPGEPDRMFQGLRRLLAPNPSPMTFRGTNTYLVGTRDIAVIDPGPPDQSHLDAILKCLGADQRISHIFVTHSHADHSPLAMALAQVTGARIHGFGPSTAGRAAIMANLPDLGGGEGIDETFIPDVVLQDGNMVEGSNWRLEALHTPGHMGNHMCYAWPDKGVVFTGDLVMGWATSMVSPPDGHLTDFMASLERLKARENDKVYYPGHGGAVEKPHARLAELIAHRRMRERQILSNLDTAQTPQELTRRIYADVDQALWPAAERNVLAHLIDLNDRGLCAPEGQFGPEARFRKI